MSRFFQADSDSDASDSSQDKNLAKERRGENVDAFHEREVGSTLAARFTFDDTESEDECRVVKTQKEKRYEEIQQTIKTLKNSAKIKDQVKIGQEYEKLQAQISNTKLKSIIRNEGVPDFYLRTICQLSIFVEKSFSDKDARKRLSPSSAKALSKLRQHISKKNKLFVNEVNTFRKENNITEESVDKMFDGSKSRRSGDSSDSSSDSSSSEDDEDDLYDQSTKTSFNRQENDVESEQSALEASNYDDVSSEDSSDQEYFSSSSEDDDDEFVAGNAAMYTRDFQTLKKKVVDDKEKKGVRVEKQSQKTVQPKTASNISEQNSVDSKAKSVKKVEWDIESIGKKLEELVKNRGRSNFNIKNAILDLEEILEYCKSNDERYEDSADRYDLFGEYMCLRKTRVTVLCMLLGILNERTSVGGVGSSAGSSLAMDVEQWNKCYLLLNDLIQTLTEDYDRIRLMESDNAPTQDIEQEKFEDKNENSGEKNEDEEEEIDEFEQAKVQRANQAEQRRIELKQARSLQPVSQQSEESQTKFIYVYGNLYNFVLSLDNEFRKSLQSLDYTQKNLSENSKDDGDEKSSDKNNQKPLTYDVRLEDEHKLLEVVQSARKYYKQIGSLKIESQLCSIKLEHIYMKREVSIAQSNFCTCLNSDLKLSDDNKNSAEVVELCEFIWKHGSSRQKLHALLQRISHLSLHNDYGKARDLLLMSHISESISKTDIRSQILFNRTQAYMALAAQNNGLFLPAMNILSELFSSQFVRELLAQGITRLRKHERNLQAEQMDRKRAYPAHLYISLELLESVYLLCAMLYEIPNLVLVRNQSTLGSNFLQLSLSASNKYFLKLYNSQKLDLIHGSDNFRDLIMTASDSLSLGNWQQTINCLSELPFWSLKTHINNRQHLLRNHQCCSGSIKAVQAKFFKQIREISMRNYLIVYGRHYSSICLNNLSKKFDLDLRTCSSIVSCMIADRILRASIDQPRKLLQINQQAMTNVQQKAYNYVERLNQFAELNERLLESRFGSGITTSGTQD